MKATIKNSIEKEPGAAQICIRFKDGKIIVTHTDENGPILFEKEAKTGDWDKLWSVIKD